MRTNRLNCTVVDPLKFSLPKLLTEAKSPFQPLEKRPDRLQLPKTILKRVLWACQSHIYQLLHTSFRPPGDTSPQPSTPTKGEEIIVTFGIFPLFFEMLSEFDTPIPFPNIYREERDAIVNNVFVVVCSITV